MTAALGVIGLAVVWDVPRINALIIFTVVSTRLAVITYRVHDSLRFVARGFAVNYACWLDGVAMPYTGHSLRK